MSSDFLPDCNVMGRCRVTARWAVQSQGYGRCSCSKHKMKAMDEAEKACGSAAGVKIWPLGFFDEEPVQLQLPIEEG